MTEIKNNNRIIPPTPNAHVCVVCPNAHVCVVCLNAHVCVVCPNAHICVVCPNAHVCVVCPNAHVCVVCPNAHVCVVCPQVPPAATVGAEDGPAAAAEGGRGQDQGNPGELPLWEAGLVGGGATTAALTATVSVLNYPPSITLLTGQHLLLGARS